MPHNVLTSTRYNGCKGIYHVRIIGTVHFVRDQTLHSTMAGQDVMWQCEGVESRPLLLWFVDQATGRWWRSACSQGFARMSGGCPVLGTKVCGIRYFFPIFTDLSAQKRSSADGRKDL